MIERVFIDAAVFLVSRLFTSPARVTVQRPGPQMSDNAFAEARRAYAKWAATNRLEPQPHREDVFRGMFDGRRLVLTTGIASRNPTRADIAVDHASEDIDAFVTLRRRTQLPDVPLAALLARSSPSPPFTRSRSRSRWYASFSRRSSIPTPSTNHSSSFVVR